MYRLDFIRHAPKDNRPESHGTGVEASLVSAGVEQAKEYARNRVQEMPETGPVRIITTSIDRAINTGLVISRVWEEDPRLQERLRAVKVDKFVGSAGVDSLGNAVNLGPPAMSRIWGEAKADDTYTDECQAEERPLRAWCDVGFNDTWNDTGISLGEIARRLGHFVDTRLEKYEKGPEENRYDLAISHSGDIEPFLYMTLAMMKGRDLTDSNLMVEMFHRTGGGIQPLEGIAIAYNTGGEVFLTHPAEEGYVITEVDRNIFAVQTSILKREGIGQQILELREAQQ